MCRLFNADFKIIVDKIPLINIELDRAIFNKTANKLILIKALETMTWWYSRIIA